MTAHLVSMQAALASVLACPECGGTLTEEATVLPCRGCGRAWPVRDGIPVFVDGGSDHAEQRFRESVAARAARDERARLLAEIASHHAVDVMRRRAAEFSAAFAPTDWLLDLGVGWGWHWDGHQGGPAIVGVDLSLGNLRVARRLLGEARVLLVCANATALPLRAGAIAGVWSVQTLQHLAPEALRRCQTELDRVLREDAMLELHNAHPAPLKRTLYRLAGRRLATVTSSNGRTVARLSAGEWAAAWLAFRPGRTTMSTGFSELFFHADLGFRPRRYPTRLEAWLADRAPGVAALIAGQSHVRITSGQPRDGSGPCDDGARRR